MQTVIDGLCVCQLSMGLLYITHSGLYIPTELQMKAILDYSLAIDMLELFSISKHLSTKTDPGFSGLFI